jgi:S-(hydroxymethyl)glutathione dehydrogenase/alcohol dehydrogenase
MKAAVLEKLNSPLAIKELQIPKLDFGQVLVQIYSSGICGAQMDEIFGAKGEDKYLPHLLGHEGGGVVIDTGVAVTNVKQGDHVVMHWRKGVGIDAKCPIYTDENGHSVGGGWITTFNEQAIISENRLTPISEDIPLDIAALMGCAVTTGLGIINNEAKLKFGQSIAVAGCGGVGLNVIQGAALAGADRIVAIDIHDHKLSRATLFGATDMVNISQGSSIQGIDKVDVFVDCTGDVDVIEQGYSIAKKTILVGQPHCGQFLLLHNMRQHYCGKILMDSQGGLTNPTIDIPRYLKLYRRGKLDLGNLITDRYPLDRVNEALDEIRAGNVIGRCMLRM